MQIDCDYFSRNKTECFKGLLAVLVLLHHVYQKAPIFESFSVLDYLFRYLGYYCVSGFFFISGYGLYCSFKRNGGGYLQGYQRNRVLPIFIINALLVVVYTLQKYSLGMNLGVANIAKSFIYGGDVVDNGWFLLVIMLLYEFFYISAKYCANRVAEISLTLVIMYMVSAKVIGMPLWWHTSCIAFPLGGFFGTYKEAIDTRLPKRFFIISILVSSFFILTFYIGYGISVGLITLDIAPLAYLANIFLIPLHTTFFIALVLLLLMLVPMTSTVLKWLSTIYLEIYVLQGLVFNTLRNPLWYISEDYLFIALSVLITLILSWVSHPVFDTIIKNVRRLNLSI